MAIKRVEKIYEEHIEALPAADRLRLVELIAHGMAATVGHDLPQSRSFLDLKGLGEEIWQGIDAQVYVNGLRKKWDHRP
jgi:hypothetical protein